MAKESGPEDGGPLGVASHELRLGEAAIIVLVQSREQGPCPLQRCGKRLRVTIGIIPDLSYMVTDFIFNSSQTPMERHNIMLHLPGLTPSKLSIISMMTAISYKSMTPSLSTSYSLKAQFSFASAVMQCATC